MLKKTGTDHIPPKGVPYWYPKDVKFFGQEPRRNLKRGITHPYQMFSRRNLIALSILWYYIHEKKLQGAIGSKDKNPIFKDKKEFTFSYQEMEKLRFIFSASIFKASRMCGWKLRKMKGVIREDIIGPDGIRMGTLYIPSIISEENMLINFERKYEKIKVGMPSIMKSSVREYSQISILKHSALDLSLIPNNSVDYLYFDPPYGGNINYSELNMVWETWLEEFTDMREEIIENNFQKKDRQTYGFLMTQALKESSSGDQGTWSPEKWRWQ